MLLDVLPGIELRTFLYLLELGTLCQSNHPPAHISLNLSFSHRKPTKWERANNEDEDGSRSVPRFAMPSSSFYGSRSNGSSGKSYFNQSRHARLTSPRSNRSNSSGNTSRTLFSDCVRESASPVLAKKSPGFSRIPLSPIKSPIRSPLLSPTNNNNNNADPLSSSLVLDLSLASLPIEKVSPHEIGFPNFGNFQVFHLCNQSKKVI